MYRRRNKRFRRRGARRSRFRKARRGGRRSGALKAFYGKKASQAIIRQPSGLPDRLYVKLKYMEQLAFSQTTGNVATNVYRGNSLFDPDLTGTGGQPYLYDQWSAFYGYYTVLACSIRVHSMSNAGAPYNTIVCVFPSLLSTGVGTTGQELAEEQPYSVVRALNMGSAGAGQGFIKHYMSSSKIFGVKRTAIEIEDGYSSAVSTSPTNNWYWHVNNWTPGGQNQSLIQNVVLTYYVVFESRLRAAIS